MFDSLYLFVDVVSVGKLSVISDEQTLIRVISTGTALWTPGGVFETNCEADVTYYPLDTQECRLVKCCSKAKKNQKKLCV